EAEKYAMRVEAWFKEHKPLFREKGKELESVARMELPGHDVEADVADLSDAVEIIRWYQFQIHVKLARALSGIKDEEMPGFPSDSDGSAKVALIGLDRSLAAWARLRQHFPDKADELLDILVQLERIRRRTEARFPKARDFKRPGFDD